MQTHIVTPETLETLQNRRNGSLRKLATELGFAPSFAGALGDILNQRAGHVSLETENRVRVALGLVPIATYVVPACPDCGAVDTGRCHGIADPVVVIHPHHPPHPQSPAWLREAAEWLAQRQDDGPQHLCSYTRRGKPNFPG